MAKNNIIVFLVVVIVILTGVFVYFNTRPTTPSGGGPLPEAGTQKDTLPPATGNIDDVVKALLQGAENEQPALNSAEDDKSLIISDSQEVSGFNQSVNENEF